MIALHNLYYREAAYGLLFIYLFIYFIHFIVILDTNLFGVFFFFSTFRSHFTLAHPNCRDVNLILRLEREMYTFEWYISLA